MNYRRLANPAFIFAFTAMAVAAVGMGTAISHYGIYLRKLSIFAEDGRVLRAIPTQTANWARRGQDIVEAAENLETLGTDNYLTRQYLQRTTDPAAAPKMVQLHAAYYTGMIDTVPHVPERCLTGGGLTLVGGPWTVPIPLDTSDWVLHPDSPSTPSKAIYTTRLSNEFSTAGGGRRIPLPRGLTPDQPLALRISEYASPTGVHYFAGYFFIANGGWVASAEGVRLLAFDLKADYAFYLKVQIDSGDVQSPDELAALAGSLLNDLLGEIMTCAPDWTKVERGLWPPDNPRGPQTAAPPQP